MIRAIDRNHQPRNSIMHTHNMMLMMNINSQEFNVIFKREMWTNLPNESFSVSKKLCDVDYFDVFNIHTIIYADKNF